ncbi:hypothetical protein [Polaribacter ponticola]|uniref:Uncharacterized protein n=1 Tax=Polaribacter ponticola TaxID=2978475 RepID=A0ABT5S8I6_9FLAO|nr:hypothetical protein [Polaribacter sp. MSW5]MDD7914429.1 hypothetical protein [Polaribacter sp. MSW5]
MKILNLHFTKLLFYLSVSITIQICNKIEENSTKETTLIDKTEFNTQDKNLVKNDSFFTDKNETISTVDNYIFLGIVEGLFY